MYHICIYYVKPLFIVVIICNAADRTHVAAQHYPTYNGITGRILTGTPESAQSLDRCYFTGMLVSFRLSHRSFLLRTIFTAEGKRYPRDTSVSARGMATFTVT